ncbi:MAG: hypothetical protein HYV60_04825 [Planctomycetia bacterium]|nr:hypothetical protein [Planctomycetia bacterium]
MQLNDAGSLENVSLNYVLDCENGPAEGTIVVQFVGMSGALVGFNIAKEVDVDPAPPTAAETSTYRHDQEKLLGSHAKQFVPFSFDYPATWKFDAEAGTDESPNSVKVMRDLDLGDGIEYTQENFAVGSCQVSGSGEFAKLGLQLLSQQFQEQIAKGFPEYKLNREGDMKFGKYNGYGFDFTSKLPHPKKENVDCWGRRSRRERPIAGDYPLVQDRRGRSDAGSTPGASQGRHASAQAVTTAIAVTSRSVTQ